MKTRDMSRAHHYLRVAENEKGAFRSPSITVDLLMSLKIKKKIF